MILNVESSQSKFLQKEFQARIEIMQKDCTTHDLYIFTYYSRNLPLYPCILKWI